MRGDGQNQLKISAPHPVTETCRLIPLLAALISLDSPFNVPLILKVREIFFRSEQFRGPLEKSIGNVSYDLPQTDRLMLYSLSSCFSYLVFSSLIPQTTDN